ncbi:hypothetical protein PIB30_044173 [Stylosanthes scabra]|uniref:AP2/ERF domain-containing protein n=1 Tax=Stylosanthes scabra TaxID=79078 RepID=A0ABU6YD64_9FABA|nr:hypothetical protein [Stylosanthes scabra]
MASMNLLGFSLSPQEQQTHHHQTRFGLFNLTTTSEDDVTAHGNCFNLTTTPTHASTTLNNLPPFPIYEEQQPFNNHLSSHQDWKENNNNYDNQNLLLGTSCNNNHHHQQPKLENFLGGDYGANSSASGGGEYIFQNCTAGGDRGGGGGGGSTNSIGLSMIKTWLRNQPLHHHQNHSSENQETIIASSDNNTTAPTTTNSVQTLSLSMSTGSLLPPTNAVSIAGGGDSYSSSEINSSNNKQVVENGGSIVENNNNGAKKSIDTFGQRTSIYRGVTRHRWTGRYEAHLWDNSCRREGQTRKGRQGGYDKEEKAARAYDLAALKYWGTTTTTNFPISQYEKELEEMKHMTRQEYVASLRRKSSGFSRGASIYRGVTRHHQHGRWQARIGRVAGNKDLYLGTFSTQEEAAEAYDIAAIKFRGLSAVTNFDMSRYDVKSILESSTLPIGGAAKRLKDMDNNNNVDLITNVDNVHQDHSNSINSHHHSLTDGINNFVAATTHHGWPATLAFQHYPAANYGSSSSSSQRLWCKQEQDSSDHHNFHQEIHPLQLGGFTHNFFQHGIMSMDHSASMDNNNSSGSGSVVYGGGGGGDANGYVFPMGSVIGNDSSNEIKGLSYESVFGSEAYNQTHGRHLYYQQQSSTVEQNNNGVVVVKGSPYDHHHQHHGGSSNNWVPTAIPTIAASRSLCHGAPPFSLLHE